MNKKFENEDPIAKALGLPDLEEYNKDEEIYFEDVDQELLDSEFADEDDGVKSVVGEIVDITDNQVSKISPISDKLDVADDEYLKDIYNSKHMMGLVIRDSHDAFEHLVNIAKQTENPRAFEVASKMMVDIINANKSLIEMSERKREIKSKNSPKSVVNNNTTNNNLVLSTADFLKLIKQNENK